MKDLAPICIGNFLVTPLKEDLDIYSLHHGWAATSEPTETMEDFVQSLIDQELVSGSVKEDCDPSTVINYLTWPHHPSPQDLDDLREALPGDQLDGINNHQLEILATGYKVPAIDETLGRDTYFKWLADPDVGDVEYKIFSVANMKMDDDRKEHISRVGWSLMQVGAGRKDPGYTYSVGLSAKVGYEFIVIGGGNHGGPIINEICTRLVDNGDSLDDIETLDCIKMKDKEGGVRVGFIDVDMDSHDANGVMARVSDIPVISIKKILIADKNGLLPGEEGYDEGMVQTLTGI